MLLHVSHLTLDRGGRRIVSDLSFGVAAGEALVLTGPNGAGKTTLIRAIAGLLTLAGGEVRLQNGLDDTPVSEQSHFIGHRDGVKAAMSVAENVRFFAEYLSGTADRAHSDAALERLGLTELSGVPAGWLSAGQRRRLGLTRLLVARRPVWLLDEPTVSLDAASVETLAAVVAEHRAGGGIVIAATHIPLGLTGERELRLGQSAGEARRAL